MNLATICMYVCVSVCHSGRQHIQAKGRYELSKYVCMCVSVCHSGRQHTSKRGFSLYNTLIVNAVTHQDQSSTKGDRTRPR